MHIFCTSKIATAPGSELLVVEEFGFSNVQLDK